MANEVQCKCCGFLALLNKEARSFDEAYKEYRGAGEVPTKLVTGPPPFVIAHVPLHFDGPRCFVLAHEIDEEYQRSIRLNETPKDAAKYVTDKDRTCGGFTEWVPGFKPKEHKEMQLESERIKRDEERERDNAKREAERDCQTRNHNWLTLAVAVGAVAVSVFGVWKASQPPPPITVNVQQLPATQPQPMPIPAPAQPPPLPAKTLDQPPTQTSPK